MSERADQLAALLARANGGDPAAVLTETDKLLGFARDWPSDERFELWRIRCRAYFRANDYSAALACAHEMWSLAEGERDVGRLIQSLGHRAEALVNLKQVNSALEALLQAEVTLIESDGAIDVAQLARGRFGLANAYTDLSFYELAVEHCRAAVDLLTVLGTASRYLATATLNLGIMELDWAIELLRAGAPGTDQPLQDRLIRQAIGHLRAHRDMPVDDRGGLDDRCAEFLAIAEAMSDPKGGVVALKRILRTHEILDRNDRVYLLSALARAQRAAGRMKKAARAARSSVAQLEPGGIFANTERGARFELHQAELALGRAGARRSEPYIRSCETAIWEQRENAVQGFLARRDLHTVQLDRERHRTIARQDPLTGAFNRRALSDWFDQHPTGPAFLALVDVDEFKAFNDNHGHQAGDAVLCRLADALREASRNTEVVVRYGGDEFVIVGAGNSPTAQQIRRRIHRSLDRQPQSDPNPVRVSIGVATAGPGTPTGTLFQDADLDMFRRKRSGDQES